MKFTCMLAVLTLAGLAQAAKLSDYQPFKFEVLFNNPSCAEHRYETPVLANDGSLLVAKPKDVYCKKSDIATTVSRDVSPQYRLIEWINDPNTRELFLAYLSFSNKDVAAALCEAAKRDVKIDFVLDSDPSEDARGVPLAEGLKACGNKVSIHYRGNRGGSGYAHNKLMMVNPSDATEVRIVYSSGNMSTGPSINHENFNFVTTSPQSYFAQVHRCLQEAQINHADTRKNYTDFMAACRQRIGKPEEEDIRTFFVPGEGRQALKAIREMALRSNHIDATAHRFSGAFLKLFTELLDAGKAIRLITDDDMYWTWKTRTAVGGNMVGEAFKVMELKEKGMDLRFIETNHSERILQHNKYMIFDVDTMDAVFHGAGNFTSAAFDSNFENFYMVTIPEVAQAYQAQYRQYWEKMATPEAKLPVENITP